MTSEPGVLPKNYGTLSFSKIAPEMIRTMLGVKKHITNIEQSGEHLKQNEHITEIDQEITE